MAPLEPQKKVLVAMEFLDSDHGEIPCETCHGGNADASDKSVALTRTNTRPSKWASSATAVNATPGCGGCHVSRPKAVDKGFVNSHLFKARSDLLNQCTACHGSRVGNEYLGKRGQGDI